MFSGSRNRELNKSRNMNKDSALYRKLIDKFQCAEAL